MTVSGVGSGRVDISQLSIGEVLAVVTRCTRSTDQQIRELASRMQDRAMEASRSSSVISMYEELAREGRRTDGEGLELDNPDTVARFNRMYEDHMGPRPTEEGPEQQQWDQLKESILTGGGTDHVLSQDDIKSLIANERECLNQLNSGNEIEMLALQTLMQGRQTTIQMGSQFINAVGETSRTITGNIR